MYITIRDFPREAIIILSPLCGRWVKTASRRKASQREYTQNGGQRRSRAVATCIQGAKIIFKDRSQFVRPAGNFRLDPRAVEKQGVCGGGSCCCGSHNERSWTTRLGRQLSTERKLTFNLGRRERERGRCAAEINRIGKGAVLCDPVSLAIMEGL